MLAGLGSVRRLRPENRFDEIAGYAVADNMDLRYVIGPDLGQKSRVWNVGGLFAVRPQRQDVPGGQHRQDHPPKPKIAARDLVLWSRLRPVGSLRLLTSGISRCHRLSLSRRYGP